MTTKVSTFSSTEEQDRAVPCPTDFWAGQWICGDSVRYRQGARPPDAVRLSAFWYGYCSRVWHIRSADSAVNSLVSMFVGKVSHLPQVERIFWKLEDNRVRVWTIMNEPKLAVENEIYDTQLELMDLLPDMSFDFAVIFRQGKSPGQISPEGATRVFARQ